MESYPSWAEATIEQTALVIKVSKNSSTTARTPEKVVLLQDESDKIVEITINQVGYGNSMSLAANYSTSRCKMLVIEPTIEGFEDNPTYKWTLKGPNDSEEIDAGTEPTLSFIQLITGDYVVSFTISDDSGLTETKKATVNVSMEAEEFSPYISDVLEYKPAPLRASHGLTFNAANGATSAVALQTVKDKLVNSDFISSNMGISIGTLGGYIIFKFDHTVINVKGKRDFRIGSYASASSFPAPGIVYVSFDANGNGEADDEWYELAGSEYGNTTSRSGLKIVYDRPTTILTNSNFNGEVTNYIPYTINESETGAFTSGTSPMYIAQWPYWLQEGTDGASITFTNVAMIAGNTPVGGMYPGATTWYEYGYANNNGTDQTRSSFDIDWAVDEKGNKVHLPGVDFIKVQTATLQYLGSFYGPSNTLINSAIDLHLKGIDIPTLNH